MVGITEISSKFEDLRVKAQDLLLARPEDNIPYTSDILEVIGELRIYQAELEIQNEELKRTQKEISQLRREYEDLYELAPCGYLTLNAKGIITRANQTAADLLLGKPRARLGQSSFSRFISKKWEERYLTFLRNAGRTGENQTIELQLNREKQTPFWVRADISADRNSAGEVTQWRIVLIDINARKAAEKEKKRAEERLRQSQKMESIGTLAGGIAHEFNNILSIILGNCELAMDDVPEWNDAKGYLEEIRMASLRARDVVQQLLTFSRKNGTECSPIWIGPVVRQSMQLIRSLIPANIHIRTTIAEDVAPISGNTTQINQLLINLCKNASDAVQEEKGVITVDVCNEVVDSNCEDTKAALPPGRCVRIRVADNGSGMDQSILAKIFEPYFTTKIFGQGSGIGLAVVHGIVERHHGVIAVESEPGKGTVFTIWLPVFEKCMKKSIPQKASLPTGDERILLVDDEPAVLKLERLLLEKLGYAVTTADDPLKALEKFKADPAAFDLVITDMTMPHLTGDRLAREILLIRPQIPIIICTGHSDKISGKSPAEVGVCTFAQKPLERSQLALNVRDALDSVKKIED